MIIIDDVLCSSCGNCVDDCPSGVLTLEAGKVVAEDDCLQCGHCVAICPEAAVSIPLYDMADVEDLQPADYQIEPQQLLRAIKFRRSVRDYQDQPVEREKFDLIVEAGRYTPTAINRQDCRFVIVQEKMAELKKMVWAEIGKNIALPSEEAPQGIQAFKGFYEVQKNDPNEDFLFRNAPAVICVAADVALDGGLASQNMETMAAALGLGMLYNGYLVRAINLSKEVKDWLGFGEKQLVTCMLVGYSNLTYYRTAPRRNADVIWR